MTAFGAGAQLHSSSFPAQFQPLRLRCSFHWHFLVGSLVGEQKLEKKGSKHSVDSDWHSVSGSFQKGEEESMAVGRSQRSSLFPLLKRVKQEPK